MKTNSVTVLITSFKDLYDLPPPLNAMACDAIRYAICSHKAVHSICTLDTPPEPPESMIVTFSKDGLDCHACFYRGGDISPATEEELEEIRWSAHQAEINKWANKACV